MAQFPKGSQEEVSFKWWSRCGLLSPHENPLLVMDTFGSLTSLLPVNDRILNSTRRVQLYSTSHWYSTLPLKSKMLDSKVIGKKKKKKEKYSKEIQWKNMQIIIGYAHQQENVWSLKSFLCKLFKEILSQSFPLRSVKRGISQACYDTRNMYPWMRPQNTLPAMGTHSWKGTDGWVRWC